jgi:hypothetical protein
MAPAIRNFDILETRRYPAKAGLSARREEILSVTLILRKFL